MNPILFSTSARPGQARCWSFCTTILLSLLQARNRAPTSPLPVNAIGPQTLKPACQGGSPSFGLCGATHKTRPLARVWGLGWRFCIVFGASTDHFPDLRSVQFFAKRFLWLYIGAASLHCAPPSHSYSSSTNPQNLNLDTSRSQLSCELRFRAISSAIDI